jgi:hypothetical protein
MLYYQPIRSVSVILGSDGYQGSYSLYYQPSTSVSVVLGRGDCRETYPPSLLHIQLARRSSNAHQAGCLELYQEFWPGRRRSGDIHEQEMSKKYQKMI